MTRSCLFNFKFMLELSRSPSQSQGSVDCALCYANLDSISVPQREIHYENHFSSMMGDNPPRSPSSSKAIASSQSVKSKVKRIWPHFKETDDFWYPAHASTPPPSFTPGILVSCCIHPQPTHQILISQRVNSSHPSRAMQRS
jgi:hypothetical protein